MPLRNQRGLLVPPGVTAAVRVCLGGANPFSSASPMLWPCFSFKDVQSQGKLAEGRTPKATLALQLLLYYFWLIMYLRQASVYSQINRRTLE